MRSSLLVLALLVFAGCASDEADPAPDATSEADAPVASENVFGVADAYTRAAPAGGVSAVFLQIENTTATADTLVAARTDASDDVQIHETVTQANGQRGMQEIGTIAVPAGGTVSLEPGGLHVMLLDLNRDLVEGDTLLVEFDFADRGTLVARAPIRGLGS
ncbi:MAG: copper chaperone PCu(A)C [Bacteroidota bacterium]